MNKLIFQVLVVPALLCLSACGGDDKVDGAGTGGDAATSLTLDRSTLSFVTDSNSTPPSQSVVATFQGDGLVVGTPPGATLPSWLYVNTPSNGTNPASVTFNVSPILPSPGRYTTTLRFATGRADGTQVVTRDVSVTLTVNHVLSTSIVRLDSMAGAAGAGPSSTLSVNTAGATWEATTNQPWVTVTPTSGTGSRLLTVSANTASLSVGIHTATVTVRDTFTNVARTATVELALRQRRLDALPRGVAFTSTVATNAMSRAVQIIDTAGLGGRWTASDDAPWLQVSPSMGTANSPLTLTANGAGLADGMYYATVTVSPDAEPGLTNTVTVKVGLYVDHTSSAPTDIVTVNAPSATAIVADPIRPFVYVGEWTFDSGSNTSNGGLAVYNFYTGQLVDSFTFPGRPVGGIAISPDGGNLLVSIANVSTVGAPNRALVPVALNNSTRTVGAEWTGMQLNTFDNYFKFTEIDGLPVVATGRRQILDVNNGAVLAEFESSAVGALAISGGYFAVTPSGNAGFIMVPTSGNHRVGRYRFTQVNGVVRAVETHNQNESGNAQDIATSADGSRLLTLSEASPNSLRTYDAMTMTLVNGVPSSLPIAGKLDIAPNGDIYQIDRLRQFTQYGSDLVRLGSRTISSSDFARAARVSGDGQRAVVVSSGNSASLYFFNSQLPP